MYTYTVTQSVSHTTQRERDAYDVRKTEGSLNWENMALVSVTPFSTQLASLTKVLLLYIIFIIIIFFTLLEFIYYLIISSLLNITQVVP